MCWAIPAEIIKIEDKSGIVKIENITKETSLELIENPKIGDYVLVHAGYAIEKVDKESAEFTIKFFRGELKL